MGLTKIPARDYTFELDPAGGSSFVEIGGINTWSHKNSNTDTESTDFDSDGRDEHYQMGTGDSFTLEGFRKADVSNGARDAGQAACETLARAVGIESRGAFRFTSPDGEVKTFEGTAKVDVGGGGNNDLTKWSVEVKVAGDITTT